MRRYRWVILLLGTGIAVYLKPAPVLAPLGRALVQDEGPAKSDCLFVLAGDGFGKRVMRSVTLFREGYAPKVLVSGPHGSYGKTEDELSIAFARENGATDVAFVGVPNHATSTVTEAQEVLPVLREQGCRSVLVVTSDYHTRRAGRILRRHWPGITVRMTAAEAVDYHPDRWWQDRQSQKTFLLEWTKTFADWLGI